MRSAAKAILVRLLNLLALCLNLFLFLVFQLTTPWIRWAVGMSGAWAAGTPRRCSSDPPPAASHSRVSSPWRRARWTNQIWAKERRCRRSKEDSWHSKDRCSCPCCDAEVRHTTLRRSARFLGLSCCSTAFVFVLLFLSVNVEEADNVYKVTAEVPGFDKEVSGRAKPLPSVCALWLVSRAALVCFSLPQNLKVNISDDNVLTITGEQKKEHIEESRDKRYLRSERAFGRVVRSLRLPKNIDKTKVNASYLNGILHVDVSRRDTQLGGQRN